MAAEIEFLLLGPLIVRRSTAEIIVPQGKQRVILAMLLLNAGRVVRTDELAEALWSSRPPSSGPVAVQNYVMRLRNALGDAGRARIITQPPGYLIRVEADELDVSRFEALCRETRTALRAGEWADAFAAGGQALGLWRAAPLLDVPAEGLRVEFVPRLERLRLQVLEDRFQAGLRLGQHQELIPELLEATARHPMQERFHAQLILALTAAGRRAQALSAYQRARRALVEELGIEPGLELRKIHRQVLAGVEPESGLRDLPGLERRQSGPMPAPETGKNPRRPPKAALQPGNDAGQGPALGLLHSLPPDTAAFTGRQDELGRITAAVNQAAGPGGVVAICAIGGTPGVGKTALAVHAAHLLKDRFPDRQLFFNLHAHTPGQDPLTPAAALGGLLAAAGADAKSLPAGTEERAALWRDRMAGQRALIVLDNAASSAQVTPLLPGSAGCLVLVTSRRHLGDLPGAATPVQLPLLSPQEAREMFVRLAPRAAAGPDHVLMELAGLAGFLPLAVCLLARVYARHPSWTLADLAAETRAGLLTLTAERDSVAAAFALSYRGLAPGQQQFFRSLGLHPGASTDPRAAAALAGIPLSEAAGQLDALHGEGLVTETSRRRYGMHDLIRAYARDLAAADPASSREQALRRLLDYYQHAARLADEFLARQTRTWPAPALQAPQAVVPDLTDRAGALAWARAERDSLLACLDHATATGQHARIVALTAAMASLLRHDGPLTTAITCHSAAAEAARHLGDRLGQANALNDLGDARRLTGDHRGAVQALQQALDIARDTGDKLGQGNALHNVGIIRVVTGDYPGAAQALRLALDIAGEIGDKLGQGNALQVLGDVQLMTGDYPGAAQALQQALDIARDTGNQLSQGNALQSLGMVRRMTGDYPGAEQSHEQALGIARDIGYLLGQGTALQTLGVVRRMTGDYPGAAQALQQALDIAREIGDKLGLVNALSTLGAVRRMTGDYPGSAQALEQALDIARDIGNRGSEAEILNETGELDRVRGDPGRAADHHRHALNVSREITSLRDKACALAGLGRCALALGRTSEAAEHLRQAQGTFEQIGAPEAADVAAELDSLTRARPTPVAFRADGGLGAWPGHEPYHPCHGRASSSMASGGVNPADTAGCYVG